MLDDFAYPTIESKLIVLQIGLVCVNWSSIDNLLGLILGHYINAPNGHLDIATSIVDLSRKCELISGLSFLTEDKTRHTNLVRTLNFIDNDLRPRRNRYVHDGYRFFTGDNIRLISKLHIKNVQSRTQKLTTWTAEPVTSEEISAFNADLDTIATFLSSYFLSVIAKPVSENAEIALGKVCEDAQDGIISLMQRYRSKPKAF